MKRLPIIILLLAGLALPACKLDPEEDAWEYYKEWRIANDNWIEEQEARTEGGADYYTKIVPDYNKTAYILIRYLNDRKQTEGHLTPLYTSTVDVKYIGRLYNDEPFDSSYLLTNEYGDSLFRFALDGSYRIPTSTGSTQSVDVIDGWKIALMNMRVGDSCEVILPYDLAYGRYGKGNILPYSNLKFNIKLVDIPAYERPLQ